MASHWSHRRKAGIVQSANHRYTREWRAALHRSLVAGTAIHAALFLVDPSAPVEIRMRSQGMMFEAVPISAFSAVDAFLAAAPEVEERSRAAIPPAPELELEPTSLEFPLVPRFEEALRFELPAPPVPEAPEELAGYEIMSRLLEPPEIRNRSEIERFLARLYRPILRDTNATGVVTLLFWVDDHGEPQRVEVVSTSGSEALDALALSLPEVIEFLPARRGRSPVKVIVRVPIAFKSQTIGAYFPVGP
jgi:periplasmic protein TonB